MISVDELNIINKIKNPVEAARIFLKAKTLFRDNIDTAMHEMIFEELEYKFVDQWAEIVAKQMEIDNRLVFTIVKESIYTDKNGKAKLAYTPYEGKIGIDNIGNIDKKEFEQLWEYDIINNEIYNKPNHIFTIMYKTIDMVKKS